ncbi:hypothetical protein [Brucella intermedia]|uniref:Uncharacterized protein n=1 Tax=Brucella intermedia M86 TaxID=1234597 RepID=M5JKJ4_9HYPH|nr:hypothetical protein [Brucella intermedia]ELT47060.1 hypothetical protein D584_21636 [Brucella intermedia M86]
MIGADFGEGKEILGRFTRSTAAIMAIPADSEEGTIECPTCRRPLHYAFTATGRLKAHCETPNCTSVS